MNINLLSIYLLSLLISTSILITINRQENRYHGTYSYFKFVLLATVLLTFLEMFSWVFEGIATGYGFFLNRVINSILLASSALPLTAWFIYLDYRVYDSETMRLKRKHLYVLPNAMIVVFVAMNFLTPILFTLDSMNHYVRGPLAPLIGIIQLFYLIFYILDMVIRKTTMDDSLRNTLILLAIFPILGWVLQGLFLGSAFLWPMMNFLVFNSFIVIERDEMFRDVLTNLYSRSQLEKRVLINLRKNRNFQIVMIDLDDLKGINDRFGHEHGDYALQTLASILSTSIRKTDYAYRFAGDEFMLILNTEKQGVADEVINRIQLKLDLYNKIEDKPYRISMSYGCYFVDASKETSLINIFAQVDERMYKDKFSNKKTPYNRSYVNQV